MDRENTALAKCQAGFMDIVVRPLYKSWNDFAADDASREALDTLRDNRAKVAAERPAQRLELAQRASLRAYTSRSRLA